MKFARFLLLAEVTFLLILSACGPAATVIPPTATMIPAVNTAIPVVTTATSVPPLTCAQPVKVGLITSITSGFSHYGASMMRSFMLGMEYATGSAGSVGNIFDITKTQENTFTLGDCQITIYVADDKSLQPTVTAAAQDLITNKGVNILVGTVNMYSMPTLQTIVAQNHIPLIVAPAAGDDITGVNFNEYSFPVSPNFYQEAMNICTYLTTKSSTFVQIGPDIPYGHTYATDFRDACTFDGGTFVANDIFPATTVTDYSPYVQQVKNSGAKAWLLNPAAGSFIQILKAAADLGLNQSMVVGTTFNDNAVMARFYQNAIGITSGLLYHYTVPHNPINDWLVAQTTARYGVPPDLFDSEGMNAAILLVKALQATHANVTPSALIAAMEGMTFNGPKGQIYIRPEDHVAIQDMYILKLTNLTDPAFKFFDTISTNRPEPPCLLPAALKARCGSLPYGSLSGK